MKMKPAKTQKPKEDKEKINPREMHKSYLDRMENDLSSKGVVFFDPETNLNITSEYLELPPEITDVSSRDLGEYLNAFTQQKVYLRTLLGRIELMVEESRRKYFEVSADLYRKYSLDKMSETAKERMINAHPTVQPAYYEFVDYKKKQALVEYSITNIEDVIFMLSREVSRRTGDFNEENRAHNVGRR